MKLTSLLQLDDELQQAGKIDNLQQVRVIFAVYRPQIQNISIFCVGGVTRYYILPDTTVCKPYFNIVIITFQHVQNNLTIVKYRI